MIVNGMFRQLRSQPLRGTEGNGTGLVSGRTVLSWTYTGLENRMQRLNGKLEPKETCEGNPADARIPFAFAGRRTREPTAYRLDSLSYSKPPSRR